MAVDKKAIEMHIRGILAALGEDPDREGLRETPERVARMYEEVFEGISYTNEEIAQMYGKVKSELKAKGRPIPENDIWIAATALAAKLSLVTADSDFEHVDGLLLEKL